MLTLYSLLYTLGMLLMSPVFFLRRQKYASGFRQRLGNYPHFDHDGRKVIWLHCVSVGETNAARPLVDELLRHFRSHRLIISTTTRTGQELAKKVFNKKVDAVFYLPFDWKFTVRRALDHFRPSLILLIETEIWPRLIVEPKQQGIKVAIVNGRLSQKSYRRYLKLRWFIRRVLANIDLALMQAENDAERIKALGIDARKVAVMGNLKFDAPPLSADQKLTDELRSRFGLNGSQLLVVAASTHEPEERILVDSLQDADVRLLIAPRHPERFSQVAETVCQSGNLLTRRSDAPSEHDRSARVILLDTIGELSAVYPLADIVFVGGSLIPHGGQNVLEPAAAGKAIVTGPFTHNFDSIVKEMAAHDALIQLLSLKAGGDAASQLRETFRELVADGEKRRRFGAAAREVFRANSGAAAAVVAQLRPLDLDR